LIIIFDAVNQLQTQYHDLHWLPLVLPPRVHVILSCLSDGITFTAVQKRGIATNNCGDGWKWIQVQPLEEDERVEIMEKQLSLFGKSMPENILVCFCCLLIL
jgi:hypothetical protein